MKDYQDYDEDEYGQNEYENDPYREQEHSGGVKQSSVKLLTVIQITVCAIILLTAAFLRISGQNAYAIVRSWYVENINKTIIPDEQVEIAKEKVISLFPAASGNPLESQPQTSSEDNAQGAVSSTPSAGSTAAASSTDSSGAASSSQQPASSGSSSKSPAPVESQSLIN